MTMRPSSQPATARARRLIKETLQPIVGRGRPSVLIASIGRSGSTLVYNAVLEAAARASRLRTDLAQRVLRDTAWDLHSSSLRPGAIYKTHDLARDPLDGHEIRAVFLFGPASDAALSVIACRQRYGDAWVEEHFEHLHARGRVEDLLHRDALGFERQINSWSTPHSYPILLLHYEAMWDYQEQLSDFLDLPVRLPERRPRRHHGLDGETERQVRSTFRDIDTWIDTLPRFQLLWSNR